MFINETQHQGITIFQIGGRIDSFGAGELGRVLDTAFQEGKTNMLLDMASVRSINKEGLGLLADILLKNRARGGDLQLVALQPRVVKLFHIIGFDQFFVFYDCMDAALDTLFAHNAATGKVQ